MHMEELQEQIFALMAPVGKYGMRILFAIITFWIALRVIDGLTRKLHAHLLSRKVETTLNTFLCQLVSLGLKVLLAISLASTVGIETTSFVAVLGAMGLAVGLALQGSLGNFAGTVLILVFKPFRIGDVVEVGGVTGTVTNIHFFATTLATSDNRTVTVPNGALSNGTIINYTVSGQRRVDMVFSIGYGDDVKKAKDLLADLLTQDSRVLRDPAPLIALGELGESSVNLYCRPWVKAEDYWDVYFSLNESVKAAFDQNGISIPFPQRDVHVHQVT